jgi:hypothetical protein
LARSDAEPSFSIGFVPIDPNALPQDAAALQEIVRTLLLEHGELHAENDKLRLLVQRFVRHQFGRRSEQLSPDQLQLGLEDLEQTIAANQAGQDPIAGVTRKPRSEPAARNHGALPAHLPRYEVVMDVEDRDSLRWPFHQLRWWNLQASSARAAAERSCRSARSAPSSSTLSRRSYGSA